MDKNIVQVLKSQLNLPGLELENNLIRIFDDLKKSIENSATDFTTTFKDKKSFIRELALLLATFITDDLIIKALQTSLPAWLRWASKIIIPIVSEFKLNIIEKILIIVLDKLLDKIWKE